MRNHRETSARVSRGFVLALVVACAAAVAALAVEGSRAHAVAQTQARLDATIFTWDGKDFVRTETTLTTEDGKSAANTKLDHATPAYKALAERHSYVGDVTVFGKHYHASYAPLIGKDGRLTGALFVATAK